MYVLGVSMKKEVSKLNNVLIKLGSFGMWHKVETLVRYDDGSFDICWGQDWTMYPPNAKVQVNERT